MNKTTHVTGALLLLFSFACSTHMDVDEGAADSASEPRKLSTCRAWCEAAVDCSTVYAQEWKFTTQDECESRCVEYHDGLSNISNGACDEPMLDFHDCAAALTCDEFTDLENHYWQTEIIVDPPCQTEYTEFLSVGLCT